jgi:hypothetical protein
MIMNLLTMFHKNLKIILYYRIFESVLPQNIARFCYSNARLSLCLTTFKIRDIPFPTHFGHYIELLLNHL